MNGESTVVPKTEIPLFKYDKNEDNKNKKRDYILSGSVCRITG